MLDVFKNWLIRKLGGRVASDWSRLDEAQNLLLPLDSCNLSAQRVAVSYFTRRSVSKYSGCGDRTAFLTVSFFGAHVYSKDSNEWLKLEWNLSRRDRVVDAISQLLIFTDPNPGSLMDRLNPDEKALLLVALKWAQHARKAA